MRRINAQASFTDFGGPVRNNKVHKPTKAQQIKIVSKPGLKQPSPVLRKAG